MEQSVRGVYARGNSVLMQLPSEIFQTVTVTRWSAGSYDSNGRFVDGSQSTIAITASVQPASPQDLIHVEEGNRTKDVIVAWTETELTPGNEALGTIPDHITWQGNLYECHKVERFNMGALPHYKAIAIRHQI